jgi:threonylcarbamoyladenosine tRNA methylthiotransferase MtaB
LPDPVPVTERKRRNKMLRILSAKKLRAFYNTQKGKELEVIFEHENKNGYMHGFTQNYVKVKHPFDIDLCNASTNIIIKDFDEEGDMVCELKPSFVL